MRSVWDVIIVGAGPAGMCAAIETARQGLHTLVLDRQSEPGGQIFKSVGSSALVNHLGSDYSAGRPLVEEFKNCGATFLPSANVWDTAPDRIYFSIQGQSRCVTARQVVLATGAMERPVPLPGWTLPGVMGSGASDILLKSASLLPQGPVVLCGNGPLILQAAVHMHHFKVPVAGVLFTGRISNLLRAMKHITGALARPGYFLHGIGMAARTVFTQKCTFAVRDLMLEQVEPERLNISFTSMGGGQKSLQAATVLLHEGVISESRITRLARCRHTWDERQRYWHVSADVWGQTSVPGIRTAGDVARVRGAAAAQAEGRLVGLDVCHELGRLNMSERNRLADSHMRIVRRCQALQPFLDEYFAPAPSLLQPADDAVVCRCEELTARDLQQTIRQGCFSPDGLKAHARPGMGTCQGRMCGQAVAEMIAHAQGLPLDQLPQYTAQPPLFPLSLGELADMLMPPDLN